MKNWVVSLSTDIQYLDFDTEFDWTTSLSNILDGNMRIHLYLYIEKGMCDFGAIFSLLNLSFI